MGKTLSLRIWDLKICIKDVFVDHLSPTLVQLIMCEKYTEEQCHNSRCTIKKTLTALMDNIK